MTKKEIQEKTINKVKSIQTLAKQLQIEMVATERISEDGLIDRAIIYKDMEDYKLDEEKKDVKTTNLP